MRLERPLAAVSCMGGVWGARCLGMYLVSLSLSLSQHGVCGQSGRSTSHPCMLAWLERCGQALTCFLCSSPCDGRAP